MGEYCLGPYRPLRHVRCSRAGCSANQAWLRPCFFGASVACAAVSFVVWCWPLRSRENRAKVREVLQHPRRWIGTVEPYLIPLGLSVIVAGLVIAGFGLLRQAAATLPGRQSDIVSPIPSSVTLPNSPSMLPRPLSPRTQPYRLTNNSLPASAQSIIRVNDGAVIPPEFTKC